MNQKPNVRGRLVVGTMVAAAVVIICAIVWWSLPEKRSDEEQAPDAVSEDLVADFFTSLAALDVEQNELAAQILSQAVELEPQEPALWANLAVAHLRLRDMDKARESMQHALGLAPDAPQLALLRAEVLEQAGEIEAAIEQLREIHQVWPENISATYSLVMLLGQLRSDEAEAERLTLLEDILARAPGILRARCEQARVAATLERSEELRTVLDALLADSQRWPPAARQKLIEADQAAGAGDFRAAALALAFFENLLKPHPEYQQSLAQLGVVSAGAIGTPLRSFLVLKLPPIEAADADANLTFQLQRASETAVRPDLVQAVESSGERSSILMSLSEQTLHVGESAALPFPGSATEASSASIGLGDLNFDFQQDLILVGTAGCRIFLAQADGSFLPQQVELDELNQPWRSVWTADVDADGDLDLLLSDHQSPLRWIRNNGDMTFAAANDFITAEEVVDLEIADFDADGDVDLATLDASGTVAVWQNERGGRYIEATSPVDSPRVAIAVADVDRDGGFDLVSLEASGELHATMWKPDATWSQSLLTTWSSASVLDSAAAGDVLLAVADLDNNGALDIVASASYETGIWLQTADGSWTQLRGTPALRLTSVADVNGDGLLDLAGMSQSGGHVAMNQSQAGYGWHVIRPTANTSPGDSRINSVGIGGRIEVRAGNLVQSALIRSPRVHFGLGRHEQVDVARIVWPNGTMQAEFALQAGQRSGAVQRLSTSCPWVFAFDGQQFRFVKDFIWRSPLGLRINAQATAGVTQTEDWIKIAGTELAAVDQQYPLRITAELWETHFFDHVGLLAVDHPAGVEVFVDERFVPNEMPRHQVIVATQPQPLLKLANHRGTQLDEQLRSIDGVYASDFALGEYQGVAEEHWIEFEVPADVLADRTVLIVGHGWLYPTNSSLNAAIAQRSAGHPFGLILEQQRSDGTWQIVSDNLGFPAGKNKDVILELPAGSLELSRTFRLRTNMEIYWDTLAWSYAVRNVEPRVTMLPVAVAELRHRGFSRLLPLERRLPDTPVYEVVATGQRWLDLEGHYTRFGDVRELLAAVDDRYVIMNAGDELVFEFDAADEPPPGWQRDFVLVGDGWVKDGDFNTAFSRSVRPLPAHEDHHYAGPLVPLHEDPVYVRYPDDWRDYHTRYVTPRYFQQGLWRAARQPAGGENRP